MPWLSRESFVVDNNLVRAIVNKNARAIMLSDFISLWRDLDFLGVSSVEISEATGLSLQELSEMTVGGKNIDDDRLLFAFKALNVLR